MLKLEDVAARHPEVFPFLLVDKILGAVENERAVGLRNVTSNDPLLAADGRRPYSMRRGLLVEAFAQLAAIVLMPEGGASDAGSEPDEVEGAHGQARSSRAPWSFEVSKIDSMRFLRTPAPGDQIVMTVELSREDGALKARCKAEIGGDLAAEGTLEIEVEGAG